MGSEAEVAASLDASAAASVVVLRVLDECVVSGLRGTGSESIAEGGVKSSPADAFVDALIGERDFPDDHAAMVLRAVKERAGELAAASAGAPKAFLHIASLLNAMISGLPGNSATCIASCDALVSVGTELVRLDALGSPSMFRDLQLPGLLPVLRKQASKRLLVLRALYAFTPRDARSRKAAVSALRDSLADQRAFLHCVSVLAFLEPDMDPELAEQYLYYAGIGGSDPSPRLRAASVGIIAAVVPADPKAAAHRLASLQRLAGDSSWWEVRV